VVLADVDPELDGLALGIPAGVLSEPRLGKGAPRAILLRGAVGRITRTSGRDRVRGPARKSARPRSKADEAIE
jgi:hypothetical protein